MSEAIRQAPGATLDVGVARHELIILAGSAGGLEALMTILRALPGNFPVPIVVLLHRSATSPSVLSKILSRRCKLRVKDVEAGERFVAGMVYVAPATEHLIVGPDRRFHFVDGTRINFLRSAADPLIQSAAHALGSNVIAVILSGGGENGTGGVRDVRALGGTVIAQDPTTARHPGMPSAAIATGAADYVLSPEVIAQKLIELTPAGPHAEAPSQEAG